MKVFTIFFLLFSGFAFGAEHECNLAILKDGLPVKHKKAIFSGTAVELKLDEYSAQIKVAQLSPSERKLALRLSANSYEASSLFELDQEHPYLSFGQNPLRAQLQCWLK